MFPDLEASDRSEHPDAARPWSRKKIAVMTGGLIGAAVASLFFAFLHDSRLEPLDDLKRPAAVSVSAPGPEENGYLLLRKKWEKPLDAGAQENRDAESVIRGLWPWDGELAEKVLNGKEALREDLRGALNKPHWEVRASEDPVRWLTRLANVLHLEAMAALRAGDLNRTLDILADLQLLSGRMLTLEGISLSWNKGIQVREMMAARCCEILDSGRIDGVSFQRMQELWKHEPLTRSMLTDSLFLGIDEMRQEMLNASGNVDSWLSSTRSPKFRRFCYKPNRTLNHHHAIVRSTLRNLAALPENLEGMVTDDSVQPAVSSATAEIGNFFNPGREVVELMGLPGLNFQRNILAPLEVFWGRAMKVRLAIYQWQQAHGGGLPEKLTELIPDTLANVPLDPWNGQPLAWDAKEGIIFATGYDPSGNGPHFESGRWISYSAITAGLRLNPPAPTPKMVKAGAKAKKVPPAVKPVPSVSVTPSAASGDGSRAESKAPPAPKPPVSGGSAENGG